MTQTSHTVGFAWNTRDGFMVDPVRDVSRGTRATFHRGPAHGPRPGGEAAEPAHPPGGVRFFRGGSSAGNSHRAFGLFIDSPKGVK